MMKALCCPSSQLPKNLEDGVRYFTPFESPAKHGRANVGFFGRTLPADVKRAGLEPSELLWDFAIIALSIAAADNAFNRKAESADGWTREIEVSICLNQPLIWLEHREKLESTFRFLTGDFWKLIFLAGGERPPKPNKTQQKNYDADCVSLLSGGVDSLVGAIDLTASKRKPLFVSQIVAGDSDFQRTIASKLGAKERHLQWSFNSTSQHSNEGSTRGRSIVFFAYALLASCAIDLKSKKRITIYVPENGFISLNVALNSTRLGSLSTKTTHPFYLKGLQEVWTAVGIPVELCFPKDYQFRTKGELLSECLDQSTLQDLIPETTSCGRYGTYNKTHCGRCIPCLVRRAAFLGAEQSDTTAPSKNTNKIYHFENLRLAYKDKSSLDIRAAAAACLLAQEKGIERIIGGALSRIPTGSRSKYAGVVERGLNEIGELLKAHNVI
jgi:hypothetical protein